MSSVKWYGDQVFAEIRKATPDALFAAGEKLIAAAAARAPRASGFLAESGYVASETRSTYRASKRHRKAIKPSSGGVIAGFAAINAAWVEYGTRPHTIGKDGRILRLRDGTFRRGPFRHPGTPARPFLRPALDELKGDMSITIAERVRRKVDK